MGQENIFMLVGGVVILILIFISFNNLLSNNKIEQEIEFNNSALKRDILERKKTSEYYNINNFKEFFINFNIKYKKSDPLFAINIEQNNKCILQIVHQAVSETYIHIPNPYNNISIPYGFSLQISIAKDNNSIKQELSKLKQLSFYNEFDIKEFENFEYYIIHFLEDFDKLEKIIKDVLLNVYDINSDENFVINHNVEIFNDP